MQINFTPKKIKRAKEYLDKLNQTSDVKKIEKKTSLWNRIRKIFLKDTL